MVGDDKPPFNNGPVALFSLQKTLTNGSFIIVVIKVELPKHRVSNEPSITPNKSFDDIVNVAGIGLLVQVVALFVTTRLVYTPEHKLGITKTPVGEDVAV
jgi:hypothetical protein